jgi:FkbM family methyltransferase
MVSNLALLGGHDEALSYLRALSGEPIVLDLGANVGVFSLMAASANQGARVFAYEPGLPNIRMIEMNRLINPNLSDRIVVRTEAVGGKTRVANFFYSDANPQGSSICYAKGTPSEVQVRAFSEVLDSLPKAVALVKMDIEGAEYEILEGTPPEFWKRVEVLCVEMHQDPSGRQDISGYLQRMAEQGFTRQLETAKGSYFLQRQK